MPSYPDLLPFSTVNTLAEQPTVYSQAEVTDAASKDVSECNGTGTFLFRRHEQ